MLRNYYGVKAREYPVGKRNDKSRRADPYFPVNQCNKWRTADKLRP
jgi:hypothetical protein